MRRTATFLAACAVVLVTCWAGDALAQKVISKGQSFVTGRLLPGTRQDDGSRVSGLRLTMAQGWKTYWRSPGEAGIPPSFDWSASENVASVRVLWPRPEVFVSFGLQTIGYSDQVVLPMIVTPVDPGREIRLAVTADLGVCKEICVLEHFSLSRTIATDERPAGAGQIARARAAVPPEGRAAGLDGATCRITGAGRDRRLDLVINFNGVVTDPVVVVEGGAQFWVTNVVTRLTGPGTIVVEAVLSLVSENAWVTRQDLRMTVLADNMAADIRGCTAPAG